MAIVSCRENDRNRGAVHNRTAIAGYEDYRSFVVVVDDPPNDTALEVLRAPCLPYRDEVHPEFSVLFADEIRPRQRSGTLTVWDVDVTYKARETPVFDSPFDDPVERTWGYIRTQEPYERDVNGVPILNAAGEPFDPPPERDVTRPTLVCVRKEPAFSIAAFIPFYDSVNNLHFFGAAPGQAKFMGVSGRGPLVKSGFTYWEVTYEFHFREEPWHQAFILNQGLNQLVENDSEGGTDFALRAITREWIDAANAVPGQQGGAPPGDAENIPITEPVPLDPLGRILPRYTVDNEGNRVINDLFYLVAQPYKLRNFNQLPFGSLEEPLALP